MLERQVAAIVWRTSGQTRIEEMAGASRVPVINGLTDEFHPCQILADLQTVRQHKGSTAGLKLVYLGDGANNMSHSYLLGGATAGMHVVIASPAAYQPDPAILARAAEIAAVDRRLGRLDVGPAGGGRRRRRGGHGRMGVDGARSPGRRAGGAVRPLRGDRGLMAKASSDAIVLHCLPAYRGKEIEAAVIDGPQSVVWDEAENRLHAQKALLSWLLARSFAA